MKSHDKITMSIARAAEKVLENNSDFVELEEAKFKKGDSVKIKNVTKYDALAKDNEGTVIGMMSGRVMVQVGTGQMNVDPKDLVMESVDLEEATLSQSIKTAAKQINSLEKSLKVGSNLNKGINKLLEGKYDADFKEMEKGIDDIIQVWDEIVREFAEYGWKL